MIAAGKAIGQVVQAFQISVHTFSRRRNQYVGMKAEQAKRLKQLEAEEKRLKWLGITDEYTRECLALR